MKLSAFCIRDEKAQAFMTPIHFHYKGQASRWFEDQLSDKNVPMHLHPEDYSLYHVGYFDPFSGALERLNTPELVCHATDFKPVGA